MALKDVAPLLAKEFITLKLDHDRQPGAQDVVKKYAGGPQGLPWFGFLDGDAKAVITSSSGPKGNIGCPWAPHEIEYFQEMLEKSKRHLTSSDIAYLIKSLKDYRDRVDAGGSF